MSLYYNGNLEEDLKNLSKKEDEKLIDELDRIGKQIGYGRCQQVIQILWAKYLNEKGYPTNGALFR